MKKMKTCFSTLHELEEIGILQLPVSECVQETKLTAVGYVYCVKRCFKWIYLTSHAFINLSGFCSKALLLIVYLKYVCRLS